MDAVLEFARGPLFVFCLGFMVLGLLRHVLLTLWEVLRTIRRAGDKDVPYRKVARATLRWLVPLDKLRTQAVFSLTSILFHVAILVVPLFLAGHVVLWTGALGVPWPAIPNPLADVLTILAVVTAVALVIQRLASGPTRALSRPRDYLIPLLVAVPFATGFLAAHPALNPFAFEASLLVHVLSGDLILFLMPITKLSHAALLPGVQIVSELGWRWPSDSGSRVGAALNKQGEPV